jgi:hypothetical protein
LILIIPRCWDTLLPMLGRVIEAFGLVLILVFGSTGVSVAQGAPADLTANPSAITVNIPARHQISTVSTEVIASQAIPDNVTLGGYLLGDLIRDDSAARISPSALAINLIKDHSDTSGESFTLTITPDLSGIEPGRYTGTIRVTGPGVNPLLVPVTISIQGGTWYWVLFWLLLGLVVGWLLKWYPTTGSKLAADTRRYSSIRREIAGMSAADIPRCVIDELGNVIQGFDNADEATVNQALTSLEGQVGDLRFVTDVVAQLRDAISAHESEIQKQGLSEDQIPVNERRRLNDALNEAADLTTARASLKSLLDFSNAITSCLQNASDLASRTALDDFNRNLFDAGLAAAGKVTGAAGAGSPPGSAAATDGGAIDAGRLQTLLLTGREMKKALDSPPGTLPPPSPPMPATRSRAEKWRQRIGSLWRHVLGMLPVLIGLITVFLIALVGLQSQYATNQTFGSGGAIDYTVVFLWGVAALVTGKTVTDFLSNAASK